MPFSPIHNIFCSSFPPCPKPTDEEFKLYHLIDRQLYTKMIINLGRDIMESMNVMAFFLWLEQQSTGGMTLVKRILSLPSVLINDFADEATLCLKCVRKDELSYPYNVFEVALLPTLLGKNFTLQFLYQHRSMVIRGVAKMFDEVCTRAFSDINANAIKPVTNMESVKIGEEEDFYFGKVKAGPSMPGSIRPIFHPTRGLVFSGAQEQAMDKGKQPIQDDPLGEIFQANLNLEEEGNDVCPDDRTIFLTFSKGYPISETEVWDFFTRKFGDFIEEIHMQEVSAGEQVLYARLVVRTASMVDAVVGGGRAKYNINGKHVWARKFVKKNKLISSATYASVVSTGQSSGQMALGQMVTPPPKHC